MFPPYELNLCGSQCPFEYYCKYKTSDVKYLSNCERNFRNRKARLKSIGYSIGSMLRNDVLLKEASRINCNALIVFEPENIFYVTGFWGNAIAVVNENGTKLIVPKLEMERAKKRSNYNKVIVADYDSNILETLLLNLENNTFCTDCSNIGVYEKIKRKIRNKLVYSTEPFYQSRMVKDSTEIKIITIANEIVDKLFATCKMAIRVGITEMHLQTILLYKAMKLGAFSPSYKYVLSPLIIASGINSVLPHAEPTDRKIRRGDLVTVDLTLRYKGYIADATRTFAVGRISSEAKKIYSIVKDAQEAGLDAAKTGATCAKIDNVCRSLIERRGQGAHFIHSTGHGIGLEVHEPPWIRMKNEQVLERNMTITVEPGIYIPNKFGVRIEDSLLVDKKAKPLNRYTKEILVL